MGLQVRRFRRFRNPVSISLITLQYARAQYKNGQTCIREIVTKRLDSFPLTKTRIRRGGSPGQVENRPDFVLDFGDFGGSTRYRSKSVEGRPVLMGFRQFTELEPRLAGCVVLECGIKTTCDVKQFAGYRVQRAAAETTCE